MVQRASVQQQTVEHGHVRGFVSGQVYDSIRYPKILRITEHAQTVCTRPFLLPSKGLGTRLRDLHLGIYNLHVFNSAKTRNARIAEPHTVTMAIQTKRMATSVVQ